MDDVYRLKVYMRNTTTDEVVLWFNKLYAKQSTARGVATQKKNAYSRGWYSHVKFHHATIETLTVVEDETETIQ